MTTRAMLVTRALEKDDQKLLALMTKRIGVTAATADQRKRAICASAGAMYGLEIARGSGS